MAEEMVPGGEKDSVVYLGRSSFKMKVGVRTTPAPETKSVKQTTVPRITPTPSPSLTPRPALRTSRPPSAQSGSHSRPAVAPAEGELVRGVALAKTTLVGLCLTAFSCGIMCTVAVDRYWPRERSACSDGPAGATRAAAVPAPASVPAPAAPAPAPSIEDGASVAEVMPLPPYGQKLSGAEPVAAAVAAPPAPVATAPEPAAATAPAAAVAPPAPKVAVALPPPTAPRAAVPTRPTPAQGRSVARKRPAAAPAATASEKPQPSAATEGWTDPFAE